MLVNDTWGRSLRLRRLYRHADDRLFIVPMDHSLTDGPLVPARRFNRLLDTLAESGVDAVVLHKGRLRHVRPQRFADLALIVHLSASTSRGPDPNAKVLVGTVEEALRLGADAVSVHVNLGSEQERQQLRDLGAVAAAADRWGVPVLAMMYPRGPQVADPRDPELVAHAATVAVDLGADIVKTVFTGSPASMADVVRSCPVPVVAAGGPRLADLDEVLRFVRDVLTAGAAGVAMGRNVFDAEDPTAVASGVAHAVHDGADHHGADVTWPADGAGRPLHAVSAAN